MTGSTKQGLNPLHQSSLLKLMGRYIGYVTPQLYLILVLSLWLAQQAWQKNFETLTAIEAQQAQQREISLQRQPLSSDELTAILNRLTRLSPRIKAGVTNDGGTAALTLSIADARDLDAFREAVNLVISSEEGSLWSTRELCFGQCQSGPASISLTAVRQRIEVK